MATDYDAISDQYQQAKRQPWRSRIEAFTFLGLLGDLTGKAVIDLACGEGHFTRMLPGLGAGPVVGVDRSEGMIALARAQEAAFPRGIEYRVQDCCSLRVPTPFDVVSAAYLLNYASSREELQAMTAAVARCLKPGGRFVTVNANPGLEFCRGATYRKYGFEVRNADGPREGGPYTWVFHLEDGPVEVENYWLPASAYEAALESAGFREIRWQQPLLSPSGERDHDLDFWGDFLEHPPIIGIECRL
jgi:ubiquinone/menaquinone biosynthesis C-methylase UbiE